MTERTRVNLALVFMIVAVATIGGFLFGYDSGAVNGTQEGLKLAYNLNDEQLGLTVSSLLVGCAIGAFLAGRLADLIGRRNVMMVAAVAFVISALVAGGAQTNLVFVIARTLGGMAVGAASVLSPAYISEVTPANIRGRLSSIQQIMIIAGLTGAFLVNSLLREYAGESTNILWYGYEAWRWMFWMQAVPAVIFLLTLFFIPESPRYLMMKGHEDQALAVLTRLFGADAAAAKVAEIKASLTQDHHPRLSDTLKTGAAKAPLWLAYALLAIIVALCIAGVLPYIWGVPVALLVIAFVVPFRPIVRVGIGLAVFQQLVGINIVFYYGTSLWQAVGFSEQAAFQMNSLGGLMSIPACIIALLVIDRLGRRPMLLIGSAGMAVTLFIMVYAFSTGTVGADDTLHLSDTNGVIALVAAVAYAMFFNFSWGPVMWVMLGEMFPNQLRGSGLAVAGLMQWGANFAISSTFPVLKSQAGLAPAYTFYAVSAVVSYFFVMKFVKETRGKELEAMEG